MPNETRERRRPGRKIESGISGYMTAAEVADLFQMGTSTVYRLAGEGKIPPLHPIGNCKRFMEAEIKAWQDAGHVWPIPAEKRA